MNLNGICVRFVWKMHTDFVFFAFALYFGGELWYNNDELRLATRDNESEICGYSRNSRCEEPIHDGVSRQLTDIKGFRRIERF